MGMDMGAQEIAVPRRKEAVLAYAWDPDLAAYRRLHRAVPLKIAYSSEAINKRERN